MKLNQLRLPRLLSDNMVLQRDTGVKIWGWAAPGETVTLNFAGQSYHTVADTKGKWAVVLSPLPAGGPYTMEIAAGHTITLNNILVGDVWVCSGQSNMELPMEMVKERYEDIIARSENPAIRQFKVLEEYDFNAPHEDLPSGNWEPASPGSVLQFTATGYFFAKALYEKYRIPIGLINTSLGGSPAEAWMSAEALQAFPAYLETARKFSDEAYRTQIAQRDQAVSNGWYQHLLEKDKGLNGEISWYETSYDTSAWPFMQLPAYWEDEGVGSCNGVVWFRKDIDIPTAMAGKPGKLVLGNIVDSDSVYINGILVGTTPHQYLPRKYDIPGNLLVAGKNTITVRVINTIGRGGFVKEKPYQLTVDGMTIDLQGEWRYQIGVVAESLSGPTFIQWQPLGLYNAMIAPLLNFAIKGVIWYQGESNTGRSIEYRRLFPALIADWRQKWNRGDFPFVYVQLPNFMEAKDQPSESDWAMLREAQFKTLAVPNTAMAVTIDLGEWNELHPENKEDVGKRLALAAQKVVYGDISVIASGPVYESMRIEGHTMILGFSNTGGGLVVKGGGELKHFAIADPSGKFVWAKAKIQANEVLVWHDQVEHPTAVRYAWADNPEGANLYNKEGLPAAPFRTDGENESGNATG